jgi:hypothetical protein
MKYSSSSSSHQDLDQHLILSQSCLVPQPFTVGDQGLIFNQVPNIKAWFGYQIDGILITCSLYPHYLQFAMKSYHSENKTETY